MLEIVEGERLVVLVHVLAGGDGVDVGCQFQHSEGDLDGLGKEVLQTADRPTQRQFLFIEQPSLLVLNEDVHHARPLLHLVHLHFFLYDLLDLFLL